MSRHGAACVALALYAAAASAQSTLTSPGLYEIIVTQELPNVLRAADPVKIEQCLSLDKIESGEAFRLRTENPINVCPMSNLHFDGDFLSYRVVCAQPNSPRANALFERTRSGYQGTISLNMGGKNMLMTERQRARRIGECPGEDKVHSNARYDEEHYRDARQQPETQPPAARP